MKKPCTRYDYEASLTLDTGEKMTTQKGEVVLDPFLGSGTTLVAAKKQEVKK